MDGVPSRCGNVCPGKHHQSWGSCIITGPLRGGLSALEDHPLWCPGLASRPLLFFVKAAVPNLHQFLRSLLSSAPPSTCQLTTAALASLLPFHLRGTGKPLHPSARGNSSLLFRDRIHQSLLYRQTPDTFQDLLRPNPHQEAFPDREMPSSGSLTPKAKGIATSPVHRSGGSLRAAVYRAQHSTWRGSNTATDTC